jgi:NAD-dependent dihydropyrimidine dehydrogenase PreA subunit
MAHVITDTCQKDMLCLDSCPSEAIRPSKDEPAYETVTQLYINPEECMDCGACISECPTNSIFPAEELPADKAEFAEKNAAFFQK